MASTDELKVSLATKLARHAIRPILLGNYSAQDGTGSLSPGLRRQCTVNKTSHEAVVEVVTTFGTFGTCGVEALGGAEIGQYHIGHGKRG